MIYMYIVRLLGGVDVTRCLLLTNRLPEKACHISFVDMICALKNIEIYYLKKLEAFLIFMLYKNKHHKSTKQSILEFLSLLCIYPIPTSYHDINIFTFNVCVMYTRLWYSGLFWCQKEPNCDRKVTFSQTFSYIHVGTLESITHRVPTAVQHAFNARKGPTAIVKLRSHKRSLTYTLTL
jgi:hypothetical protein